MIEDYEEFNESQKKILKKYVTNTQSHIFALRNLPEVIKGALFSRYSRSSLGLRSLLLKEFVSNEETFFSSIVAYKDADQEESQDQIEAIKKAQSFYDRILDGYGDDSIGELGGAHLAIENISMLAAKCIEDCRIGGSPLEKSTRYIYFDQKVKGEYLYYRDPILMTSAYREVYIDTCNMLFENYGKLISQLTPIIEERFPKEEGISKTAYTASIRAKVLDCLRGLLPAGTLTNMGVFGNGRFFEHLIHKLHCHDLVELQDIGKRSFEELSKVIPSFVRRADINHRTHKSYIEFIDTMNEEIRLITEKNIEFPEKSMEPGVKLLNYDPESVIKVAAALMYEYCDKGLADLHNYCKKLSEEAIERILDTASSPRENRRHKSPRALEHAQFTFEIIADFGAYRDLHRHRMLTQERQLLTCDYGYYIPPDILDTGLEKDYCLALQKAKEAYDTIALELPKEAQYIVPMAYNVRWCICANLRALQWLTELRSQAAGHPHYRWIAQKIVQEVVRVFPSFERFFKFVDYSEHDLGRLAQEMRKKEKQLISNQSD